MPSILSRLLVPFLAVLALGVLALGPSQARASTAPPAFDQTQPTLGSQVISDIQQVLAKGYDMTAIAIAYTADGSPFIGISGFAIPTADGYTQQVFFFGGSTFLGTDTSTPSPNAVVTGSPASGKIDVRYDNYAPDDPLCCPSRPPVTITYTYNGGRVSAGGTPPGH